MPTRGPGGHCSFKEAAMKRLLYIILVLMAFPFIRPGETGAYNQFSRLARCKNHSACIHEVGHALDQQSDWPSQSVEFSQALELYLLYELREDELQSRPVMILEITLRGKDGDEPIKQELYAYLFEWAEGRQENMPEPFRPFYDWELAARLLQKLDGRTLYLLVDI
jgi:hypothetical protein